MNYTIFTKPWKDLKIINLAQLVKKLGFNGIEIPVRDGYQVTPNNYKTELALAVKILNDYGLYIGSVAPTNYQDIDEEYIEILSNNNISLFRVCLKIDMSVGYLKSEQIIKNFFDKILPVLEKYNVCIGVQNHCNYNIGSAIGVMHLIEEYDKKYIGAVYDPAHCAIDGEPVDMGYNIIKSKIKLVNFKSAYYRRTNITNCTEANWKVTWTTSKDSGYSWKQMVDCLKVNKYIGDICMPAEYSNPYDEGQLMGDVIIPFVKYDLEYIKYLFNPKDNSFDHIIL